jgi:hypothetical protein
VTTRASKKGIEAVAEEAITFKEEVAAGAMDKI